MKKKLGILATALSLVVCIALCGLLWWEMTKPERIEIPIPGLSWGMSADEVIAVLEDAGIEDAKVGGITEITATGIQFGTMRLSAEEVKLLGAKNVLGLSYSSRNTYAVLLRFANSSDDTYESVLDSTLRLTQVEIWVEVPAGTSLKIKETLSGKLDRAYGKPELPGRWQVVGDEAKNVTMDGRDASRMVSPYVMINQNDCGLGEAVLVYNGSGYVRLLYGGIYMVPQGWR